MLELRPSCECCDKALPPAAADAMICTYECTFCRDCVENRLKGVCPNCGGNFSPRPIRPAAETHQPSAGDATHVQSGRLRQSGLVRPASMACATLGLKLVHQPAEILRRAPVRHRACL